MDPSIRVMLIDELVKPLGGKSDSQIATLLQTFGIRFEGMWEHYKHHEWLYRFLPNASNAQLTALGEHLGLTIPRKESRVAHQLDCELRALRDEFQAACEQCPKIFHGVVQSEEQKAPSDFAWCIFPPKIRSPKSVSWENADAPYRFQHGRILADEGSDEALNRAAELFISLAGRAAGLVEQLPRAVTNAIPGYARKNWAAMLYWLARLRPNLHLRCTEYSQFYELNESGDELSPDPQVSSDGYLIFRGKPIRRFHGVALDADLFTSSARAIDELIHLASLEKRRTEASQISATAIIEFKADQFGAWVGASRATLAVVFTDIVESTRLGAEVGDEAMYEVNRAHFEKLKVTAEKHLGFLLKDLGDGALVLFRTVIEALDFAKELVGDTGHSSVCVRMGIHVGPVRVVEQKTDVRGSTVNFSERVKSSGNGGEICVSQDAKTQIDQERAARHANLVWTRHDDRELKGFPGKHVLWSAIVSSPESM